MSKVNAVEQTLLLLTQSGAAEELSEIKRGIEKESLRLDARGVLAMTDHPLSLGSALTHSCITTDYSEALLEFITPPSSDIDQSLQLLTEIHQYLYQSIGDEKLWVCSMPCILRGEENIRIAKYGASNIGRMKTIYRLGLGHRYGRLMQTIAGIHYNYSVPTAFWERWLQLDQPESLKDEITSRYFGLIRNFKRYGWLLLYLFGASPAVCKTFLEGQQHSLEQLDPQSFYAPFATSLRMSDLGYQTDAQSNIRINFNSLDEYTAALQRATTTSHPAYEKIGVKKDGQYLQLNTNLLQIDNEYYSPIRPKQTIMPSEKPTSALVARGVEYIELRCIDLNPFIPTGINASQIHFLDTFLTWCLLQDSPPLDSDESRQCAQNVTSTALSGRDPELKLLRREGEIGLRQWGEELIKSIEPVASLLDEVNHGGSYQQAIDDIGQRLRDDSLLPSARILDEMEENGESFFHFAMRKAVEHEKNFKSDKLNEEKWRWFEGLASASLSHQQQIEESDSLSFDQFLAQYFAG